MVRLATRNEVKSLSKKEADHHIDTVEQWATTIKYYERKTKETEDSITLLGVFEDSEEGSYSNGYIFFKKGFYVIQVTDCSILVWYSEDIKEMLDFTVGLITLTKA